MGHSIVVIEHNLEVLKCADWIIDLGPEAGDNGGEVVAAGTPEQIAKVDESHTGRFLRSVLGTLAERALPACDGRILPADSRPGQHDRTRQDRRAPRAEMPMAPQNEELSRAAEVAPRYRTWPNNDRFRSTARASTI